ncbi:hypothetical protein FACS1894137_01190 [Spirochaetia bacterium]|nr:hypothetical protein FACS1894137_01190 [Spirochaetia bacterium]
MRYILRKKLREYRLIILDMDGTLYYQIPLRICMVFELLVYYTIHFKNIKDLFVLAGFRKSYNKGRLPEANPLVDYWMQERPLKYIHIFRDNKLLDLIQYLKNEGTLIALYSDYPLAKKISVLHPFATDFSFCASDSDINCLKPDVKGLKRILEVLNKPVEDAVFIGDRYDKDGKCAEGMGMDYIILDKNPILRNSRLYKSELL